MSDQSEVSLDTTIVHTPEIFWQDVVNDVLMLDTEQGHYFGAEDTGAHIWRFLEQPVTVRHVCDHLVGVYDVQRETCESEVLAFIQQLHAVGLVKVVDPTDE